MFSTILSLSRFGAVNVSAYWRRSCEKGRL